MADAFVSNLVVHLSQLLANEVNFLQGVETDVKNLCIELEYMNNFLKNSEGKRGDDNVMILVRQIRNVAREAEDIIDTYVLNVTKGSKSMLEKARNVISKPKMLHNVGIQIKQLKERVDNIYANRDKYNIEKTGGINIEAAEQELLLQKQDLLQQRRKEVEENDVVGFVEEAETLVDQLVKGTNELDVVSISGMGGLGKTTLAKRVFNNPFIKDRFRCRAWVTVSQEFKLKELLLEILNKVTLMTEEVSKMKVEELKKELKKQFSHHRYLVVLDDIWSTQHWVQLQNVFPNDENGSRVFLTTRNKEVALGASKNPPLYLRFLNDGESWKLFTKKVFRGGLCPEGLEPIGKEIVAKCKGLPLAIVVLGSLLASREKTEHSWEKMVQGAKWHLAQETICLDILALSYRELPSYLQPCFLYLGLYPEDYKIPASQLIQMWISEGFILKEDEDKHRKEDVAEDYLRQLIDRSLIQVEETSSDCGIKTCRVHDLIRDLCRKLCAEEEFLESHVNVQSSQTKPRRLSVRCSRQDYILKADTSNTCHVRTLLCFNQDSHKFSDEHWVSLFKSFELLRVLDLGDEEVQRLPKSINSLILLKYLRVITSKNAGVPTTICALGQLQTLDLRRSTINVLPKEIWSMQQLRHLYLDGATRLPKNEDKKCLPKLQSLCYVYKDPKGKVHIAETAPNLRKLGLYGYRCTSTDDKTSTFNLRYLESLKFTNECTFKERIQLPSKVTKITIKKATLQTQTIEMFQSLPELRILKLDGASFLDNELVFGKGWFPKLQVLKIEDSSIVKWKLEKEAVPKLKRVVISNCPGLNMLPKELWDISTLQEVVLSWLPKSCSNTIDEFKKSDQLKVAIYSPLP